MNIRVVAVGMALREGSYVKIARDRPLRIDVEFAVESNRASFVQRRLRAGEHRACALLGQQLDRRRADDAEHVAGADAMK